MIPSESVSKKPWRYWSDAITTIAILAMCGFVVYSVQAQPKRRSRPEPPLPKELQSLSGARKGSEAAKVGMIEYSDFQCPYCGFFARQVWPEIDRDYVSLGRLLAVFRHFPVDRIHPLARRASEAPYCAGNQGRFWEMKDLLFQEPSRLEENVLSGHVSQLRLDKARFATCLEGDGRNGVNNDTEEGERIQISSTPFFLFGMIDASGKLKVSHQIRGAQPAATFRSVLNQLLKQAG